MEELEWREKLKNPRNPYDTDLRALRAAVEYLLEKVEMKKLFDECSTNPELPKTIVPTENAREVWEGKKKGRPKNNA